MIDDARSAETLSVTVDGPTVPTAEILTGRGFVTGASGSETSNTTSVLVEALLSAGHDLLVVDTDGGYAGLKRQFDVVHVGGDDADVHVGPEHAERVARLALEEHLPVVLDVSGFDDDVTREVVEGFVAELFTREKRLRKPFLLVVEEIDEYLPGREATAVSEPFERVARHGRKRGLGLCGVSQRPSAVDRDFLAGCDWTVWHRLSLERDLRVVEKTLGVSRVDAVQDFSPEEGLLVTDWNDRTERVRFRRRRTRSGVTSEHEDGGRAVSHVVEEVLGDDADVSNTDRGAVDRPAPSGPVEPASDEGDDLPPDPVVDEVKRLRWRNRELGRQVRRLRAELDAERGSTADPGLDSEPGSGSTVDPDGPDPPRARPPERSGLAGTALEFAEMTVYSARFAGHRVRAGLLGGVTRLWAGLRGAWDRLRRRRR